ncbi:transcriptional regulator, LysR family [Pseudosulfitobacter pseudonitzschiae]|uniref:LysR family transcriptional regulator n=1 Tax=Pseudosulfitobacter pseudonitzschiae TaxID=1402135 RepID=A0A073J6S9_9RHOB|nr:LysR substrate-binding domain-containing protein [Pseudosulfitobacter pseudonitzschiae]KEJ97495.1 LysR family transcriptional regulator [Pseudosulfitobacter pseudonitzschiae]QKS08781.1 LysR family transcriptional regulator [Pseudosulfitobacter pseudonitzschiae]SHE68714.1 transcriptional regulator, LysR family [Pseudosulfitobacter pseudonitzschiae]
MSLSTARLNAIRAVAEGGSYAAAARLLGVTQPNISAQVRALEAEFGLRLFLRESGQLRPTALCLKLCDLAERAAEAQDEAERLLRSRSSLREGRIAIGLGNAMPGMAVIAAFHRAFPGVTLDVETGSHQKIARAVLTHECDIGVLPDVPADPRFRREHLASSEVIAIAPADHPLAQASEVTAADLSRVPLIFRASGSSTQRAVERMFARANLTPQPFLTLDARDGLYEAVVNGLGVGFMWRASTGRSDGVARLPIVEMRGLATHETVFSLKDTQNQIVDAFYGIAKAHEVATRDG